MDFGTEAECVETFLVNVRFKANICSIAFFYILEKV